MSYKYNPFTNNFDDVGSGGGGGGTPGGSDTEVQFNDGGVFGGDADFTYNKTSNLLTLGGDINLDDGGTFTTTLQTVTATANRTISFPNATGTVALVAGSSGQLLYNNAGANAGLSTFTADGSGNVTLTGRWTNSTNGAQSLSPVQLTGAWYGTTGNNTPTATGSTAYPALYISPTGTSFGTDWSTGGTGFGVNAPASFGGNLLDLRVNGTSQLSVSSLGSPLVGLTSAYNSGTAKGFYFASGQLGFRSTGAGIGVYSRSNNYPGFYFGANTPGSGHSISSDIEFGWSSTSIAGGTADLTLARDAADTLAQRRGTNANTFRVYGTFTDASNHVRAALSSTSTAVTLAAETAGTGADNIPLNLTAAGTGTVKVNSVAEVVVSSTVAGLPAAPVVGMLTRVTDATAPAVGVTVTGGGAAAALVWYNGANWSVIGV